MILAPKATQLWRPHLWIPRMQFSPGYPCCCDEEEDCGTCLSGTGDVTVDFGIGGWSDITNCTTCVDNTSGQVIVSRISTCLWYYESDVCNDAGLFVVAEILVELRTDAGQFYWRVTATVTRTPGPITSQAIWETALETDSDCWVNADVDGKLALAKQSEDHSVPNGPCSGTLPNTIHIWQ